MTDRTFTPTTNGPVPTMSRGLVLLFGFCCGAIASNLYYAQPISALIAPDLGILSGSASLIVSVTQIGYAAGCFFWCRSVICLKTRS